MKILKEMLGALVFDYNWRKKLKNLRRNVGGIRAHFFLLNSVQNLFGYLVVEVTNLLVM